MRIVIFTDWDHWVPHDLVRALLEALPAYPRLRLVAVCVPRRAPHWQRLLWHVQGRVAGWARSALIGDARYLRRDPVPVSLHGLARRHGFEVLVVPDANGAHAARLMRERRAQVLLSLFWKRKFGRDFLALFEQAVNYHNGRVPDFRGLRATPWSVYRGEKQSGFTFHRISDRLDLGNVLVEGAVPIAPGASLLDIERAKTQLAAAQWPAVLDAILARSPGVPQVEPARYNRLADIEPLKRIEEPASLSSTELLRRVRAFGPVEVRLGNELVRISGLGSRVSDPAERNRGILQLEDGAWTVKPADRRAQLLRRIKRWFFSP